MKILLIAAGLLLLTTMAHAEMKVTVNVSINGPSVTISGATEEDIEGGKFWRLLSEATRQAKAIWRCKMMGGYCMTREEKESPSVCGGDKLDHGSGGICPAAGGVKLCHL